MTDKAFTGRSIAISILLGEDERAQTNGAFPKPTASFTRFGGTKGLSDEAQWDKVKYTNRDSPGNFHQELATYINATGGTDGIFLTNDEANLWDIRAYHRNPTSGQPFCWIKLEVPGVGGKHVMYKYVLMDTFSFEAPDEDKGTFSSAWTEQQPEVYEFVADVP